MTHRGTWKRAERSVAAFFGTLRKPGSGSWGRKDETSSDTKHARLYIEVKYRAKHSAVALWDDTKTKARLEKKVPVVALVEKGRPGFWLLIHQDDLRSVVVELPPVTKKVRDLG